MKRNSYNKTLENKWYTKVNKGAFIIYQEEGGGGGYDDFEGGTLFPYYDLEGGAVENFQ